MEMIPLFHLHCAPNDILNRFLLSLHVIDLIKELEREVILRALVRGTCLSGLVFAIFAVSGNAVFSRLLQVHFASFQILGGLVFLLAGQRLVFRGTCTIRSRCGRFEHLAGSIAVLVQMGE